MCLPSKILNIQKDVPNIDTSMQKGPRLDYSLCYQAWQANLPDHWLVITCADDRIAGRVVNAFYDRVANVAEFPKPARVLRRGAVVYLLRGANVA